MFKEIPQTMKKAPTPKQKVQKPMTDIGGGWYMEKSAKRISPLRRTNLSKKSQEKQDEIQKKLYEANKWWNGCKFRLYWHKLEWVDPKYTPKRDKPYSVSSKAFYLNKNDKTDHWVGHSRLK